MLNQKGGMCTKGKPAPLKTTETQHGHNNKMFVVSVVFTD